MTTIKQITAPSSKSVSHRALICAALAPGRSVLSRVLESEDTTGATWRCLTAMGARLEREGDAVVVDGMADGPAGGTPDAPALLEVHESGTTCRLITGVAAAGRGSFEVRGAARMHERPIGELAAALAGQGVEFKWLQTEGNPPFVMTTRGLSGGEVGISLGESSQYLSGLLLAAPFAARETVISVTGTKVVSWPYVGLTLSAMHDAGVVFRVETREGARWTEADWRAVKEVRPGEVRFVVQPSRYAPGDRAVEGDWSNASYFFAAGALAGPLRIDGLRKDSAQGDRAIADITAAMGAKVEWDGDVAIVSPGSLMGLELDMGPCPDIVPTVAVLACFAEGTTTIRNVAHLRIKESDRLAAVADAINAAGATAEVLEDGIRVTPGKLRQERVRFTTYGDHRMAMSFSILGLGGVDVELDNRACVAKSFPTFFDVWAQATE